MTRDTREISRGIFLTLACRRIYSARASIQIAMADRITTKIQRQI